MPRRATLGQTRRRRRHNCRCPLPPGSETRTHGIQVVNWLRYRTPRRRVVYLLGGSASRESIISEANWSQQLAAISGKATSAWVLSSKCQSFEEDRRLVTALPKQRGVVVINVGLSRFLTAHKPSTVSRTSVRTQPPGGWYQHHYDCGSLCPWPCSAGS